LVRRRGLQRWVGAAGVLCLMGTFAVALLAKAPDALVMGLVSKTQALHYLLAAALLGTCWQPKA
ncbi:MAG: hypothetical protein ACKPCJ_07220, partial [Betaproteobacteria bacterium]